MSKRTRLLALILATLSSLAAAEGQLSPASGAESLFERLGGPARIASVVESAVAGLAANPGGVASMAGQDPQAFKVELEARICAVAGGGCRYPRTADNRVELLEALRVAMRGHGVPLAARNELLEALTPPGDAARLALNPRP